MAFPDAACALPIETYAEQVAGLCRSVLEYAAAADKQFSDDFEGSEWLGWQAETRGNLAAFAGRLG